MLTHTRHQPELDVQAAMHSDHERLERMFNELTAAFQTDAGPACQELWTAFEGGLREHFALEETQLLPRFARAHPAVADALRQEHMAILARLERLGLGVDLHLTRADAVNEFVRAIRDHAAREDRLMYSWARGAVDERGHEDWKKLINNALHKLTSRSKPSTTVTRA